MATDTELLSDSVDELRHEVAGVAEAVRELSAALSYTRGELRALIGALAEARQARPCRCVEHDAA